MRILVFCVNDSGMNLMMTWSTEKIVKKLGVSITKIHRYIISKGKSFASQYNVVFIPVNSLQMFQ